ncbi:MAG: hypothetical protein ACLFR7_03500 [Opitutales bacterium]
MASDHFAEFVGKKFIGASILLAGLFWLVFAYLLTPFVPTEAMPWKYIWSAFTAIPIAGVFFFAEYMFWIVLMEHRRASRAS